jgi:methyl-accepting chemotaxis protein
VKSSIRTKLLGGFIFVSLLTVAAGGFGIYYVGKVGEAADVILDEKVPVADQSMDSMIELALARDSLSEYLTARNQDEMDNLASMFSEHNTRFDSLADSITKGNSHAIVVQTAANPQVAAIIAEAQETHKSFEEHAKQVMKHHQDQLKYESSAAQLKAEFNRLSHELDDRLLAYEESITRDKSIDMRVDASMEAKATMYNITAIVEEYLALESTRKDVLRKEIERLDAKMREFEPYLEKDIVRSYDEFLSMAVGQDKLFDLKDKADFEKKEGTDHNHSLDMVGDQLNERLRRLEDLAKEDMQSAMTMADTSETRSRWTLAIITVLALSSGMIIGIVITRGITGPIDMCVNFAQRIAAGDLTAKLDIDSTDETKILADSLNGMVANLRSMVARIRHSSESVASAAEEIAAASDQITRGAQTQASASDETSSSMEQMSVNIVNVARNTEGLSSNVAETSASIDQIAATMEKTARNIDEVNSFANQAKNEAQQGGDQVISAVTAMKEINNVMTEISQTIQGLGKRSEAIGAILEVIEEIAEQTNLLALNAAIEAARAGDAGKGFAVVADEVRKLAERSADATKEISQVIKEVQAETASAVKVTENGANSAREATVMAGKAGEGIGNILELVDKTSLLINDISTAINEQSSGVTEVVKAAENMTQMTEQVRTATQEQKIGGENVVTAVENIADIAKSNLSAVEQLAKAARDMANQSEGLQDLVGEFKIVSGNENGQKSSLEFKAIPFQAGGFPRPIDDEQEESQVVSA